MPLYLAIDAGGTKTRCLLADEGRVLARASTGTVKLMRVAEEEATARLRAMLAEVAASAAVSLSDVTRTCFGLAGSRSESVRAWAAKAIADFGVGGALVISGDEEIALDAAFAGGPGILVIAGTGSNVIGRARDGNLFGAGGWGPVLGDEGSGYWIGLEAIRAALRAHDEGDGGGAAAALLREVGGAWGLASLGELVALGNLRSPSDAASASAPDFASLAPVVARLAAEGNHVAADVLQRAGEALAAFVALVHRKMAAAASIQGSDALAVAFTGSVLSEIAPVRTALVGALLNAVPTASVRDLPVDPLEGALWRARRG
jgi:N-acetylglucosamine kinase-like BadF-type ATPase